MKSIATIQRIKENMKKTLLALLIAFLVPWNAMAQTITVAGAANVQFMLDELKASFSRETGIEVKTIIGSSGKLSSQIENGAPFDIFMSADMDYPKRLFTDGLSEGKPEIYVYGRLVLWTLKDLDLSQGEAVLTDGKIKKIALASPKVAPYGRQSVNSMKYNHLYPGIASKLVYGESIAQVNQFITTQAADIGFTAKSVVLAPNMQGRGKWVDVDEHAYQPIAQGVIVLKYGQKHHPLEAKKFYDFLFSAAAKDIYQKYGYQLP